MIRVGTTGWQIPRAAAAAFPPAVDDDGRRRSALQRYAAVFPFVEVTSCFYRRHQARTWERWAASTPAAFRFAAKLSREATHARGLVGTAKVVDAFLDDVAGLGDKLGPILVQLPPKHAFARRTADAFFARLRRKHAGPVVVEPRHASWFADDVDALLAAHDVARVAADPARHPRAAIPGGVATLVYRRLHGAPVMYRSSYDDDVLDALAGTLREEARRAPTWCAFDNTMTGAAAANALAVQDRLRRVTAGRPPRPPPL